MNTEVKRFDGLFSLVTLEMRKGWEKRNLGGQSLSDLNEKYKRACKKTCSFGFLGTWIGVMVLLSVAARYYLVHLPSPAQENLATPLGSLLAIVALIILIYWGILRGRARDIVAACSVTLCAFRQDIARLAPNMREH